MHTRGGTPLLALVLVLGCAAGEAMPGDGEADSASPAVDAPMIPVDAALPADAPEQHVMPDAPIDAPSGPCALPSDEGAVCAPAPNACHIDGVCHNGVCGAIGVRPNGFNYAAGAQNRCCGGVPVQVNTSQHCGVCGISCGASACVNVGGAWQCSCTASADCWSNCCSTSGGTPYVCVPSTCGNPAACIACPGGGTCTETTPHYYCHY